MTREITKIFSSCAARDGPHPHQPTPYPAATAAHPFSGRRGANSFAQVPGDGSPIRTGEFAQKIMRSLHDVL
jgi:hypothetical protein